MCTHHWNMVPGSIRARVLAAWGEFKRSGDAFPSIDWYRAVAEAVEAVARAEGRDERNPYRQVVEGMERRGASVRRFFEEAPHAD